MNSSDSFEDVIILIDDLYDIILHKGFVITGVDVYTSTGKLVIPKDMIIKETHVFQKAANAGIKRIPISLKNQGGVWDSNGQSVLANLENQKQKERIEPSNDVEDRIFKIIADSREADNRIKDAKKAAKKIINEMRDNGGKFEIEEVESIVLHLIEVISEDENPYSFLIKNIVSSGNYLLNHSINVCTIGTAVLFKFNSLFRNIIKSGTGNDTVREMLKNSTVKDKSGFFSIDEIKRIAIGYFLHDIGKIAIKDDLLMKKKELTKDEFLTVKKHSYEFGRYILKNNKVRDPYIENTVIYHHGPLYEGEDNSYPFVEKHYKIPEYVRICRLADIYEAMTSVRPYREAKNPAEAVSDIFRKYSTRCDQLQLILHSFLKSVGSIPSGSVVTLKNEQKAFVLDSEGPVILLLTDEDGNKFEKITEPVSLDKVSGDPKYQIDRSAKISNLNDSIENLPEFIQEIYGT